MRVVLIGPEMIKTSSIEPILFAHIHRGLVIPLVIDNSYQAAIIVTEGLMEERFESIKMLMSSPAV